MVHDLAESPMSVKDIDSNLYKTWHHYNGVASTAKKNGQRFRRILLGPLPLNVTEEKRKFIELFNERAKLILVDDENGGFELLDTYSLTLVLMKNQFLYSLDQPEVDAYIIPLIRDRFIDMLLDRPALDMNYSTIIKKSRYGIYKLGDPINMAQIPQTGIKIPRKFVQV